MEDNNELDNPQKYKRGLFIFRRDLRGFDNTALIKAVDECEEVLCVFIFTPTQITNNKYKSDACVQFMCESLIQLKKYVPVKFFYGEPSTVLPMLKEHFDFEAIYLNMDYTPYSRKRDAKIEKWAVHNKLGFHSSEDYMLHPLSDNILNGTNKPYTTYTFYKNAAKKLDVPFPKKLTKENFYTDRIDGELTKENMAGFFTINKNIHVRGGRKNALAILKKIGTFGEYQFTRDLPAIETTNLSAYNKFGCVSPREIYHTITKSFEDHPLVDQLIWRDFYYYLLWYFPHSQNGSFHTKFDKFEWDDDKTMFKKWRTGKTGFPLVDAGMRQMNATGYMHNRVRMVCAQFLVKNLLINWKVGELYFATKLVDYDPAQNVGNWQWNASTGVDRFRFGIRMFSPFQSDKYDTEAIYIKRWIPELQNVSAKHIHTWSKDVKDNYECTYPAPIVDYKEMAAEFKKRYTKI